jgi:hypothetical protein
VIELYFRTDGIHLDATSMKLLMAAIDESFSVVDLKQATRIGLDVDLESIVSTSNNKGDIVFELVKYAEAQHQLLRLVQEMKMRNRGGSISRVFFVNPSPRHLQW